MTFGMSVRNRRRDMRLSQKELAQRIGVSVSTVCMIEEDKRDPSWDVAVRIVRLFGTGVITDAFEEGG